VYLTVAIPAFSDVNFLKSGEVVIGTLVSASGGNVVVLSLGKDRIISAGDIIRTEPDIQSLRDITLDIYLKDGTLMRGIIVDYDEDIGIFIDISFGNIALPLSTVERIMDPTVAKVIDDDTILGLSGQVGWPISSDFGVSGGAALSLDLRTKFLPQLYFGTDVYWSPLNLKATDEVRYMLAGFNVHALYKFTGLGENSRFFTLFVPFARLGGGAVLVQMTDNTSAAAVPQQGGLTGAFSGQLGLEMKLPPRFWLKGFLNIDMVLQSGGVFVVPSIGLGASVSL
jgi:hypothetical protein